MGEVGVQTDLAAWLLACIDEDERLAQSATPGPWDRLGQRVLDPSPPSTRLGVGMAVGHAAATADYNETAEHIVRWDPARVLVECDTKRRIIEMYPIGAPKFEMGCYCGFQSRDCGEHRTVGNVRAWCHDCNEWCYPDAPCASCHGVSPVLRLMAVVYKDRDGYVEAWAPDGR